MIWKNVFRAAFWFSTWPPTADEIEVLLRKLSTDLPEHVIRQTATFACGNVRQALLDADNALLLYAEVKAA